MHIKNNWARKWNKIVKCYKVKKADKEKCERKSNETGRKKVEWLRLAPKMKIWEMNKKIRDDFFIPKTSKLRKKVENRMQKWADEFFEGFATTASNINEGN